MPKPSPYLISQVLQLTKVSPDRNSEERLVAIVNEYGRLCWLISCLATNVFTGLLGQGRGTSINLGVRGSL